MSLQAYELKSYSCCKWKTLEGTRRNSSWGTSDMSLAIVISSGQLQAQGCKITRQGPKVTSNHRLLWPQPRKRRRAISTIPKEASKTSIWRTANLAHLWLILGTMQEDLKVFYNFFRLICLKWQQKTFCSTPDCWPRKKIYQLHV